MECRRSSCTAKSHQPSAIQFLRWKQNPSSHIQRSTLQSVYSEPKKITYSLLHWCKRKTKKSIAFSFSLAYHLSNNKSWHEEYPGTISIRPTSVSCYKDQCLADGADLQVHCRGKLPEILYILFVKTCHFKCSLKCEALNITIKKQLLWYFSLL